MIRKEPAMEIKSQILTIKISVSSWALDNYYNTVVLLIPFIFMLDCNNDTGSQISTVNNSHLVGS